MSVTIRQATLEDQQEWLQLRIALWPECPEPSHLDEIEHVLGDDVATAFVALLPGTGVCGFVEATIRPYDPDVESRPVGFIEGWYVANDARRQGIGRKLIEAAESWAATQGCKEMVSDTQSSNVESLAAHASCGFTESSRIVRMTKRF